MASSLRLSELTRCLNNKALESYLDKRQEEPPPLIKDLLESNDLLLQTVADAGRDHQWLHQNKATATFLLSRVTRLTFNREIDYQRALDVTGLFLSHRNICSKFFKPDLIIRDSDNPSQCVSISRFLLIRRDTILETCFLQGIDSAHLKEMSLEDIVAKSCANFTSFKQLYYFLASDEEKHLDCLTADQLWIALKQCDFWGIPIPEQLIKRINGFIKTEFEAFEALNGAIKYGQLEIQTHCIKVLNNSDFYVKLLGEHSSVVLRKDTSKALEIIEEPSFNIERMRLDASLLSGGLGERLPSLEQLSHMTLNVSQTELSSTARQVLSECEGLKSVALTSSKTPQSIALSKRSNGEVDPHAPAHNLDHVTQLDLRKFNDPKTFKRISLSFIKMMPNLRDLRFGGNPCVDNKFLEILPTVCPQLEMLDLGHCNQGKVTEEGIETCVHELPNIRLLNVAGFKISNDLLCDIMESHPLLTHLNIKGNSSIRPGLFVNHGALFANLEFLDMTSVHGLDPLDWQALFSRAANLQGLKVSGCRTFKLEYLTTSDPFPLLEDLVVSAKHLEEVSLDQMRVYCPNLKKVFIEGAISPELEESLLHLGGRLSGRTPMGLLVEFDPKAIPESLLAAAAAGV